MAFTSEERHRIGSRIAEARQAAGLSQRELADRMGVTTRSIQNYESGAVIPYKHLSEIAVLGHTLVGALLESGGGSPFSARLDRLRKSTQEHRARLERHVETLEQQTELLRRQREARTSRKVE